MAPTKLLFRIQQHQCLFKNIIPVSCLSRTFAIQPTILDIETPIIPLSESKRFMIDCMRALKIKEDHAEILADVLIAADYRGHYSHGMNRLAMYVNEVKSGLCDGNAEPRILKKSSTSAWVDGQNGFGAVVGKFCMDIAIKKAKTEGIGWVSAKGSNHYGIAGYWALQASNVGFLGFSCTNSSPLVVPTRAKDAALGTNPISWAVPGANGDSFVLDMATSAVALGKIEIANRKNEPLLEGWALDETGHVTTDAQRASKALRLMPLGGKEETSGYKGTGLGVLVEILCGILADGAYGPNVRQWTKSDKVANLGHCFLAVDLKQFAPGFEERLSDFLNIIRNMDKQNSSLPVLIAGDLEKAHMKSVDEKGGVRYVEDQLKTCNDLANNLKIKPLQPGSQS